MGACPLFSGCEGLASQAGVLELAGLLRPSGSELDWGGHQVWAQVGVIVCVASPCTAPLFFLSILFLPYGPREESSRSLHSAFGLEVVTI